MRVLVGAFAILAIVSAQAAHGATPAGRHDAPRDVTVSTATAPLQRADFQFTRALPQPPERPAASAWPISTVTTGDDGSSHPRPRAFRAACNSTTGC